MNDNRPCIIDFFFFCAIIALLGIAGFAINDVLWKMDAVKHHAASWVTDDKTGDVVWKWIDDIEKK